MLYFLVPEGKEVTQMPDATPQDPIAAFAEAILAPLRDVGALLAENIDRLEAELAETRSDIRALGTLVHDRTDHLA